jgi:transposase
MELVMGCDPHLDTYTTAVVDPTGRPHDRQQHSNTKTGWTQTIRICRRLGVTKVGVEGASGYGRGLATALTRAGIAVFEIPTRITAASRTSKGKTDPGDAVAVARATARGEGHSWADTPQLEALRVVVNRRETLVRAQTVDLNQLRALLVDIDPERAATLSRIRSKKALTELSKVRYHGDTHRDVAAQLIRSIARTCLTRHIEIAALTGMLKQLLPPEGRRLVAVIHGCGVITAATLCAELAGTNRFATHAKFAAWTGTAPIPVSSGRTDRHRLNRGGNRQANRALHTIIITQHRQHGEAHTYITRRCTEGKTPKEAIRAAKRHLARRIWKLLNNQPT